MRRREHDAALIGVHGVSGGAVADEGKGRDGGVGG